MMSGWKVGAVGQPSSTATAVEPEKRGNDHRGDGAGNRAAARGCPVPASDTDAATIRAGDRSGWRAAKGRRPLRHGGCNYMSRRPSMARPTVT